jgi:hypothetical protein
LAKSFGKYAIVEPVTHHFAKEEQWWWKIIPPTSGNELSISKFLISGRTELGIDGVRRDYPPTNIEVSHREIALLFGGTNIPLDDEKTVEDGGEPIVTVKASVEGVESVLRSMPHEMVNELWDAVADAAPGWGPVRPNVKKSSTPTTTS